MGPMCNNAGERWCSNDWTARGEFAMVSLYAITSHRVKGFWLEFSNLQRGFGGSCVRQDSDFAGCHRCESFIDCRLPDPPRGDIMRKAQVSSGNLRSVPRPDRFCTDIFLTKSPRHRSVSDPSGVVKNLSGLESRRATRHQR